MSSSPDPHSSTAKTTAEAAFDNKVVKPRVYGSALRSLVVQFGLVCVCGGLRCFSPLHPFEWASQTLLTVLHPSSWTCDSSIVASAFLLSFVYSKHHRLFVARPVKTLPTVARDLLRTDVLASLCGHALAGGLTVRAYVGLLGPREYNGLTVICADFGVDRCVNEAHLFLLLSGCYTGLCIWWDYHARDGNVLLFPVVHQSENSHVRHHVVEMAAQTLVRVFLGLRWFYIAYLLVGHRVELFVANLLGMDLYGHLDQVSYGAKFRELFWIFCVCFLVNSLLAFHVSLLQALINVSLTRRLAFPMETVRTKEGEEGGWARAKMMDAMESKHELMRHLAFMDFCHAAETSPTRRADFFALSQPGGHPRNWNKLVSRFSNLVDGFSKDLEEPVKPAVAQPKAPSRDRKGKLAPPVRRLTFQPTTDRTVAVQNRPQEQQQQQQHPRPEPLNVLANGLSLMLAKLASVAREKKASFLSTASTSTPTPGDAHARSVYSRSTPLVWATRGMSHLVASSISEDRYGVTQKDLGRIIVSMLALLQTMERRATATARKNRFETRDLQLKRDLRVALKTALYRICVAFGDHIGSVSGVPPELRSRLANYEAFREG